MRILRRAAVLILLGLTLGTSWAGATPPRPAAQSHSWKSATPRSFLSYLGGLLASFWLKGGCTVDPNGSCVPSSTQSLDSGCTLDPDGRCAPHAENLDGGCTIDPDGRCAPDH